MEKYYIASVSANGDFETGPGGAAQFWSLYARKENGQKQCVLQCRDRLSAEAAMTYLRSIDSLQAQVNSLTEQLSGIAKDYVQISAENIQQYQLLKKIYHSKPGGVYFNKFEAEVKSVLNDNTQTDAIQRDWMARGVDTFAAEQRGIAKEQERAGQFEFSRHCSISADEAMQFAAELRADKKEGDDA